MKTDQTGRTKNRTERFAGIPLRVLYSAAYRSLGYSDRTLLLEMAGLYSGYNNGYIGLSQRDAARLMGGDPGTAAKAFVVLVDRGLIALTRPGHFSLKSPHAAEWRLTWLSTSDCGPTNEWQRWFPQPDTREAVRVEHALECNLQPVNSRQSEWKNRYERTIWHPLACSTDGKNRSAITVDTVVDPATLPARKTPAQIYYHVIDESWATAQDCERVRKLVRGYAQREGHGAQKALASKTGLTESRISRFLADTHNRRRLRTAEVERLTTAALLVRPTLPATKK